MSALTKFLPNLASLCALVVSAQNTDIGKATVQENPHARQSHVIVDGAVSPTLISDEAAFRMIAPFLIDRNGESPTIHRIRVSGYLAPAQFTPQELDEIFKVLGPHAELIKAVDKSIPKRAAIRTQELNDSLLFSLQNALKGPGTQKLTEFIRLKKQNMKILGSLGR